MNYFVRRGAEQLGPFSLADLQQQVQAGKISPGDMAQSEGMQDWAPVSQVIGNIPVPVSTAYGAAAMPAMEPAATVDLPPNLHWSIVLLLNIISQVIPFGVLFNIVWTLVLANWARKLSGNNNILVLIAMYPAGIIAGYMGRTIQGTGIVIGPLLILGGLVAYLIGIFKIKGAMEDYYNSKEKMGLTMSGVMTFFFSTVYLQYKVNEIAKWKKSGAQSISLT